MAVSPHCGIWPLRASHKMAMFNALSITATYRLMHRSQFGRPSKKSHRMRPAVFTFILLISVASCSRDPASPSQPMSSDSPSTEKTQQHSSVGSFAPATVQILDDATAAPIDGATVRVVCLGGTPYRDSQDASNASGLATVTHWNNETVIVNVEKEGYVSSSMFVQRSNPVIRLKRRNQPVGMTP